MRIYYFFMFMFVIVNIFVVKCDDIHKPSVEQNIFRKFIDVEIDRLVSMCDEHNLDISSAKN